MSPTVPSVYRGVWLKAMKGEDSREAAIRAKCLECTAFQRVEIANCTCHQCPLWSFRPYRDGESG